MEGVSLQPGLSFTQCSYPAVIHTAGFLDKQGFLREINWICRWIIESFRLQNTPKIIESNHSSSIAKLIANLCPQVSHPHIF